MPLGLNRALMVRTANRLRASLARDELSGLPLIAALTEADQRELLEFGAGHLAAVTLCLEASARASAASASASDSRSAAELQRLALGEVARLVDAHVRRTDLLGLLDASTLLVLAPGLEPVGGGSLAERLRGLLASCSVEVEGELLPVSVAIGVTYRSSPTGWTARNLPAQADATAA